jgi:hypothetical protein
MPLDLSERFPLLTPLQAVEIIIFQTACTVGCMSDGRFSDR